MLSQAFAASATTVDLVNEIAARGAVIEQQQQQIGQLQADLQQAIKERDESRTELKRLKGDDTPTASDAGATTESVAPATAQEQPPVPTKNGHAAKVGA